MTRNVELLEKTMQHIMDHPDKHDQADYWTACGTPSCFAGWALHFAGLSQEQVWRIGATRRVAAAVLGLTEQETLVLFSPLNTRPMLQLMVKDLINGDAMKFYSFDYQKEAGE